MSVRRAARPGGVGTGDATARPCGAGSRARAAAAVSRGLRAGPSSACATRGSACGGCGRVEPARVRSLASPSRARCRPREVGGRCRASFAVGGSPRVRPQPRASRPGPARPSGVTARRRAVRPTDAASLARQPRTRKGRGVACVRGPYTQSPVTVGGPAERLSQVAPWPARMRGRLAAWFWRWRDRVWAR